MTVQPSRHEGQPYWAANQQHWATNVLDAQHEEVLYTFGELCLYTMMWRPIDHERGLVERCSTCYDGSLARQAAAFKQSTQRECPDCFGTTFEGGFRAQILRPSIFADVNHETSEEARGYVTSDTLQFETTGDFSLRKGDYVIRFDDTRFQVEEKRDSTTRSGFGPPRVNDIWGGASTAHREEGTSTAFRLPPTDPAEIEALLGVPGPFTVESLTAFDTVRPEGYL